MNIHPHHSGLRALSLAAVVALALGCVETIEPEAELTPEDTSFEVFPRLEVNNYASAAEVNVNSVFIGLGSLMLEPLDDLQSPMLSNRTPAALHFDFESGALDTVSLASLRVPKSGRYMVTLAIEPQWTDLQAQLSGDDQRTSIQLNGTYITSSRRPDPWEPVHSPEPVPWDPTPVKRTAGEKTIEHAIVNVHDFLYLSRRTGYIRLGEVQLDNEHNDLDIIIDLQSWIDITLSPMITQMMSSPEPIPLLELSLRLENQGLGIEKLFNMAETIAR
ncbi:MAG: hypothetical protein RBU37_21920 [Myxococcota bacterium]|jgi:hypothetical protein|nr:hypothetical protein [Myxococcota bacterium]